MLRPANRQANGRGSRRDGSQLGRILGWSLLSAGGARLIGFRTLQQRRGPAGSRRPRRSVTELTMRASEDPIGPS
jgi:hypothetical protein